MNKNRYSWDRNQSRLNLVKNSIPGNYNWFFIPGGAGIDSCYLHGLIHANNFPGNCWTIDFPGNGSNYIQHSVDFLMWKDYLVDILAAHENPIIVGHSFGGMLTLLEPACEKYLKALLIFNSAPESWVDAREKKCNEKKLPCLKDAYEQFCKNPTSREHYHFFLKLCMPYLFTPAMQEKGFLMYLELPINFKTYDWWLKQSYKSAWIPKEIPTLIFCGSEDYVTPPELFTEDIRFQRNNINIIELSEASHFCWFERMPTIQHEIDKFISNLK